MTVTPQAPVLIATGTENNYVPVSQENPLPTSLLAGINYIGSVGGNQVISTATYTLPAGANSYAANDVIANSTSAPVVLTFLDVFRTNGGSGYITKVRCLTDLSTMTARLRLHLYSTAPTAINDNSPFTLLYANADKRIGTIDLAAMATEGTGSNAAYATNNTIRLAAVASANDKNIYAIVETLDDFTSGATQHLFFEVTLEQN